MQTIVPRVFILPPPGKPDPHHAAPDLSARDERPRVRQEAGKRNQCWYYAFNVLRVRYGKHASIQAHPGRQFELAVSTYRKDLSAHEDALPEMCDQLGSRETSKTLSEMSTGKALQTLVLSRRLGLPLGASDEAAMADFARQTRFSNMYDYLFDKKYGERVRLQRDFLHAFGLDPAAAYPQSQQASIEPSIVPFAQLPVFAKATFSQALLIERCAQGYGLVETPWLPRHPITTLAAALETHGPLAAGGCLGINTYARNPIRLNEPVAGHTVYGWAPGAAKPPSTTTGHMVVIVGCEERAGQKARIYYLDPDDATHPDIKPRIYTLSYALFIEKCANIRGVMGAPDDAALQGPYLLAGPDWYARYPKQHTYEPSV